MTDTPFPPPPPVKVSRARAAVVGAIAAGVLGLAGGALLLSNTSNALPTVTTPATDNRVAGYELIIRGLWDKQTEDERQSICLLWQADPATAREAFRSGDDDPSEDLAWAALVRILIKEC